MKLQRHITSKSYLFKVIVEHLMTLCWGIAETITAWVLNLLNLFMLPNWRKLELYWKANWANISSCSKNPPKPVDYKRIYQKLITSFLLTGGSCQFDLFMQDCVENAGKKSKANILYFVGWLVLILFRIIGFLNILFVSDFFPFFLMPIIHFWSCLITTMSF